MAAITQIRYRHSAGRAYYDKKLAEGKTRKETLRCLKRQISDAIFACLHNRQCGTEAPRKQQADRRARDRRTLGCASQHPYKHWREWQLTAYRVGRALKFRERDIEVWLERYRRGT
jgi:hypothetical protein